MPKGGILTERPDFSLLPKDKRFGKPDPAFWRRLGKSSLNIALGSVLYAVAISLLLDPNRLAPGGVSGIAIIISHFSQIPTGMLIIALNVPLMVLGLFKLGLRTMLSTIITTLFSAFLIDILSVFPPLTQAPLLAAGFGGGLLAAGMVLIFRVESTTGGADIVVRVLRLRFPQLKSGKLFLMFDSVVVAASGLVFGNIDTALYAAVAIIVFSFVFDYLMYGGDSAKLLYVVSARPEAIAQRLLNDMGLGVTYLEGYGAWTSRQKRVIMCALKNQFFPKAHQIILEEDPDAFLIVGQASEIFGEGFKDHRGPLL